MVLPDQFSKPQTYKSLTPCYVPSTAQRVVAFVIDILIFAPVISFFLIGLFSKLKFNTLVSIGSPEVAEIYGLYAFSYFFIWILFQTLFSYFYQATPGQYFLKMEIKKSDGSSPQLIHIFFRHLFFPFHIFTFGLSLLEKFFNSQSLCFHDKVSDTQVLTTAQQNREELREVEKKFLLSWMQSGLVFLLLVVGLFLYNKYKSISELKYSRVYFYQQNPECKSQLLTLFEEEKRKSQFKAIKKESLSSKRQFSTWADSLQISDHLFYFLTENENQSCLRREADLVLYAPASNDAQQAFAYVAKAYVSADLNVEKEYFSKACSLDSKWCFLDKNNLGNQTLLSKLESPEWKTASDAEKYILFSRAKGEGYYEQALRVASAIQKKNDYLFKERIYAFELWKKTIENQELKAQLLGDSRPSQKAKQRSPASMEGSASSSLPQSSSNSTVSTFQKMYSELLFEESEP